MRLSVQIEFDKILDLNTKKDIVIIGRSEDYADLVIPHSSISRKHCQIEFFEREFYITDLKSSNGVTINGTKIPPMQRTKIPPNAVLKIAKLDCELSDKVKEVEDVTKIQSQNLNQDFTSTIRVARIDLEKDILETREITKSPPKVKGPRNPITHQEKEEKSSRGTLKTILTYVLFTVVLIFGFIIYRSIKKI